MSTPIPIGPTASFPNVRPNVKTANFSFNKSGTAIVTFQPVDVNNPGVVTLFDSGDNAIVTLNTEGQELIDVPHGGGTYYFKATLGANILALTQPTIWR